MEKLRPGEEALRSRAQIGGAELRAGSAHSLHSDRDHVSRPQLGQFAKSLKVGFPSDEFGDIKLYYEGVYLLSVWRPLPFASSLTAVLASAREPLCLSRSITVSLLGRRLPFGWYGQLSVRSPHPQGQILGQQSKRDSSSWWSPPCLACRGLVRCLHGGIQHAD